MERWAMQLAGCVSVGAGVGVGVNDGRWLRVKTMVDGVVMHAV